jgi:hypothetical protein
MAVVNLVGRFGTGHACWGCVDDDDEITGVDVRRKWGWGGGGGGGGQRGATSGGGGGGSTCRSRQSQTTRALRQRVLRQYSRVSFSQFVGFFPRSAFLQRTLRWPFHFKQPLPRNHVRCRAFDYMKIIGACVTFRRFARRYDRNVFLPPRLPCKATMPTFSPPFDA